MPKSRRAGPFGPAGRVTCAAWVCAVFLAFPRAEQTSTLTIDAGTSLFTHSENCVACHNNLVTPAGEDVSIGVTWRSSMMANSARDPYWQAGVRRETLDHPTRAADIQDECAACHMPMVQKIARAAGGKVDVFSHLPIARRAPSDLHRLASDGISCLLSATQYLKDNRLLPRGFDKATAAAEIGVYGGAVSDPDFTAAGDRIRYLVSVPAGGPYTVEAELRYQSIAYRWARNLEKYDAPEPKRFASYYAATSAGSSVVVAAVTARELRN